MRIKARRLIVLTLLSVLIMSNVDQDDLYSEEGEEDRVEESQIESLFQDAEDAEPDDSAGIQQSGSQPSGADPAEALNTQQVRRRSTRIVKKGPSTPSIKSWPMEKILVELFRMGIQAPTGSSHKELFQFLIQQREGGPSSAPPAPASTDVRPDSAPPRKSKAKSKNIESTVEPAPKKGRVEPPTSFNASPTDSVLAALNNIQFSLGVMGSRIHSLESNSHAAPQVSRQSQPNDVTTIPANAGPARLPVAGLPVMPQWSLGSAVPAPPTGVPFFSPAAAVSPHLKSQILAGNDINLVKILLSSSETGLGEKRIVECGDVSVCLKDTDSRLSKDLTMTEFNVAFGVYRDIICEAFPDRRAELDTYLAIISDLSMSYGGTLFYEYHKSFSAKAALFIQKFNQRVDWSLVDLALISRHFTGHRSISCSICGSFSHQTNLCSRASRSETKPEPQPQSHKVNNYNWPNPSMCFRFNEEVCRYPNCKFLHACSFCGDSHPKFVCPRRKPYRKK